MAVYYPRCHLTLKVVLDGLSSVSRPQLVETTPLEASVALNGYHEPDSWSATFDAKSLPFHPDIITAAAAELYLFEADGIGGSIDDYAIEENLEITGLADLETLSLSRDGRTFALEGKDYTQLLVEAEWDPRKRLPVGRPLDEVVQEIVDEAVGADPGRGRDTLEVVFQAGSVSGGPEGPKSPGQAPILGKQPKGVTRKKVTIPKSGQSASKAHKKGIPTKADSTCWDVIYRLVQRHGLICYVRRNELIITEAQALTEAARDRALSTAWGRNLLELTVERGLDRATTPQVVATSYDSTNRERLEARWPRKLRDKTTGVGTRKREIARVTAPPGIRSKAELEAYARSYYIQRSRKESRIEASTRHLRDLEDRSLLHARPGDPIRLGWDAFHDAELLQLSVPERARRLEAQGYSESIAAEVATRLEELDQFRRPFYLANITKDWSADNGISLEFTGINYVSPERDSHAREV